MHDGCILFTGKTWAIEEIKLYRSTVKLQMIAFQSNKDREDLKK